jgi:hypothetical protein
MKISALLFMSVMFSIIFIFTNRMPEVFKYASELMNFIFALSLSIIAATIFYFVQFYLPSKTIKTVAKKELETIISRTITIFEDLFINLIYEEINNENTFDKIIKQASEGEKTVIKNKTITKKYIKTRINISKIEDINGGFLKILKSKDYEKNNCTLNTLNDFLSPEIAAYICKQQFLENTSNDINNISWRLLLSRKSKEIKKGCDIIASKYSVYLGENILLHLQKLKDNDLIGFMSILNENKVLEVQKITTKGTFLPVNFLIDFFQLINKIIDQLVLKIKFSDEFINKNSGIKYAYSELFP